MRNPSLAFLACILSVAAVASHAQSNVAPSPQSDTPEQAQLWSGNLGDEPVGAGDLISVSVAGSPELSRSYRISPEGKVTLPLLRQAVPVSGMTPPAIARAVSEELVRDKILVAPIVSVAALEYRSRRVSVVGAVKSPVLIQAVGDLKLLDAITRAQGFTPDAGPEVIVSRRASGNAAAETVRIPVKELLAGNDPAMNIPLHGGEEVRVPDAPKFYVVGNVKQPGSFPLADLEGTSVLRALALTHGTLPYTAKRAYVYRVTPGSTQRQEIAVPLKDILHRKSPDVQLQAYDILYVPENERLHLNANVLDRITGVGGSVGTALIWH